MFKKTDATSAASEVYSISAVTLSVRQRIQSRAVESSRVWTFVVDAELAVCRCQQGHYLSRRSTAPSSLVDAPVIPRFTVDRRIPSEFTSHELNSTQIN